MIKVGIIGGAGYTGGELIRILLNHPQANIAFVHSRSNAGKPLYAVHADLIGETELQFADSISQDIDALFLCLGHGESKKFLSENTIADHIRIIDLANDFRLAANAQFGERQFVYGLPELNRASIRAAKNIANPGCFATAIQLALLPLAQAGLLKDAYVTGITGSTGAGQSLSATSHFSWRTNNIQAYKTLTHQHLGEIVQSLQQLSAQPLGNDPVHFVPWRGDFARGIFVSATVDVQESLSNLYQLYRDYYQSHPFTVVTDQAVYLKQALNTNKCVLQLEQSGSKLVVHSVIDNLIKGASGQAVQNMNLLFGLDESTGLHLKSIGF